MTDEEMPRHVVIDHYDTLKEKRLVDISSDILHSKIMKSHLHRKDYP